MCAASYDLNLDRWLITRSLPVPVNHAAAGSDGQKMYIFGGRAGGNFVSNGFDIVQIYDPATNTWKISSSSNVPALPQGRGGMGTAVYLGGEFYVIGGETDTGPNAQDGSVYDRVDVYDPQTRRWRQGPPLSVARHGIYPVTHDGQILVVGGGIKKGVSASNTFEIYHAT